MTGETVGTFLSAAALALSACASDESHPVGADPTLEHIDKEEAQELIRSCKAASVISLHSGDWQLKLKTGGILHVPQPTKSLRSRGRYDKGHGARLRNRDRDRVKARFIRVRTRIPTPLGSGSVRDPPSAVTRAVRRLAIRSLSMPAFPDSRA